MFQQLPRQQRFLKLCFVAGSDKGKTWPALCTARVLGGRWAAVDCDGGRMEHYWDILQLNGFTDRVQLNEKQRIDPNEYAKIFQEVSQGGYAGVIFDTFTFFWEAVINHVTNTALERQRKWKATQPNEVEAWGGDGGGNDIFYSTLYKLQVANFHVICTLRTKPNLVKTERGWARQGDKPHWRSDDSIYEFTHVFETSRNQKGGRTISVLKAGTSFDIEGKSFGNTFNPNPVNPAGFDVTPDGHTICGSLVSWMNS